MAEVPTFADFYRAVHGGRDPFPWQDRLAQLVASQGWPDEIGVPTGLGKTACIDIAVWSLAANGAERGAARSLPTRIWYVVNRRLLVDTAWEHGRLLARLLDAPQSLLESHPSSRPSDVAAVAGVSAALRGITAVGSEGGPLHVTRLRGGANLGARPPDPSQPALVLATVPMFASQWLFRGYASSTSMFPVDAALAGIDSLVLLDEAHLARPLMALAAPGGPVACCDPGRPQDLLPGARSRPVFVALTATGEARGARFDLDGLDRAHPVVRRRLDAAKRIRLTSTPLKALPEALAREAADLLDSADAASSCVVFVNNPRTAREVHARLAKLAQGRQRPSLPPLLLTGRVREWEAKGLREAVLCEVRAGSERERSADFVAVATQTLEVGADVDFDLMVSESAGARAIIQRLGRLNRLGGPRTGVGVICHPEADKPSSIYGQEAKEVWGRLAAAAASGVVNLSPGSVADVVGEPADQPGRVGQLLPSHLWEWAKTTNPPEGAAPAELFFDGFERKGDVTLVWRAGKLAAGERLFPVTRASEGVDVPVWEVTDALGAKGIVNVLRLARDREVLEDVASENLRPGDVVILPTAAGLYDPYGWNPDATAEVLDVSPFASGVLLLDLDLLGNVLESVDASLIEGIKALYADVEDVEPAEIAARDAEQLPPLLQLLGAVALKTTVGIEDWERLLAGERPVIKRWKEGLAFIEWPRGRRQRASIRSDALDELSFDLSSSGEELAEHLKRVANLAGRMAEALGCPPEVCNAVRLAGAFHDLGKLDDRFQRWLNPEGRDAPPLAKSRTPLERREASRVAAGWPKGGRHELLSARLVAEWLGDSEPGCDRELLLHLIAAHHGEGRPLVRAVGEGYAPEVRAEIRGNAVVVPGSLACTDWDQPGRFRLLCERYGYWGLALLEAVVRQADQAVSSIGLGEQATQRVLEVI